MVIVHVHRDGVLCARVYHDVALSAVDFALGDIMAEIDVAAGNPVLDDRGHLVVLIGRCRDFRY